MKTAPAFILMLVLAGFAAMAALRVVRPGDPIRPARPRTLVLAGHASTLALAHTLTKDTSIEVAPAWPPGTPWREQSEMAQRPSPEFLERARRATAVVTLRSAASDDALFSAAHAANPRIVEIDATVNRDLRTPSIRLRAGERVGPAFALAPNNAIRLAERIADELCALEPSAEETIAENLRATKERFVRLKAEYEKRFSAVASLEVVAFSSEFDDLLEDFGIHITARIEKDEAIWTDADRTTFAGMLDRADAPVSVHAIPPGSAANALLKSANIRAVVLDPQSSAPSSEGQYFAELEAALRKLRTAFDP